MDQAIRDGSFVGLTDQEREAEIDRVKRLGDQAYLDGDYDAARAWYRNMAALIEGRSVEVVEEMEQRLGLRSERNNP